MTRPTTDRPDVGPDAALGWRVEDACANAYPCWRELRLGGWLLRAAGGATRRLNSVNPLYPGAGDPTRVVSAARDVYRRLGQSVLFRVPDLVPGAATALDRLGFVPEGETLTLMADADAARPGARDGATLTPEPEAGWFKAWQALRPDLDAAGVAAVRRAVEALAVPAAFACRSADGQPVSVAYAALHDRVAVLELVVTATAHRGRGHGRCVVEALVAWATQAGADAVCLQVAADNAPARALYRSAGFDRELYRYHYRRAQPA